LFEPLRISLTQVHRIRGELDPHRAAALASEELKRIAPSQADSQPVLDLVLLGMGEDGHVASLFPGEPQTSILDSAVYRPVIAAKPPPHRITFGYSAIQAARQVWVLASGSGKEQALKTALEMNTTVPLGRVVARREMTRIFSDSKDQRE
jgi:6-phosphogluconolactonase